MGAARMSRRAPEALAAGGVRTTAWLQGVEIDDFLHENSRNSQKLRDFSLFFTPFHNQRLNFSAALMLPDAAATTRAPPTPTRPAQASPAAKIHNCCNRGNRIMSPEPHFYRPGGLGSALGGLPGVVVRQVP